MSGKIAWKNQLLNKFSEHYGDVTFVQQEIHQLLDAHWELNAAKGGHVFKRLVSLCTGIVVGSLVDLSSWLPSDLLSAVLGRAAFMTLGYMAGDYLSVAWLPKILPVSQKLEEHHLNELFRNAADIPSLIQVLGKINQDICNTLAQDEQSSLLSMVCVFAGTVANSVLLRDAAVMAHQGPRFLATLFSFFAPRFVNPNIGIIGAVPTTWQDALETSHEESEQQINLPGLRYRTVNV